MRFNYQTCNFCSTELSQCKINQNKFCPKCLALYQVLVQFGCYLDELWLEVFFWNSNTNTVDLVIIFEEWQLTTSFGQKSACVFYSDVISKEYWEQCINNHHPISKTNSNKRLEINGKYVSYIHPSNISQTMNNILLLS